MNKMAGRIYADRTLMWGNVLSDEVTVPLAASPMMTFFSADTSVRQRILDMTESMLSKHLLLIGGIGSGKTNTVNHFLNYVEAKHMKPEDVMVVFDTKGDFYEKFYRDPMDYVIGNSSVFSEETWFWNIFREIEFGGRTRKDRELMAKEISKSLFENRKNNTQPFFTSAATDLFAKVLIGIMRQHLWNLPAYQRLETEYKNAHRNKVLQDDIVRRQRELFLTKTETLNNRYLVEEIMQTWGGEEYIKMLSADANRDFKNARSYIGNGTSNQALGVFGEITSMVNDYFVGIFSDYEPGRDVSMRELIHNKGGKKIFIEYDLSIGQVLTPVYSLLIDLAMKEALGRSRSQGNVFFVIDEMKLLPKLQYLDDGINFGRSLGVKVLAGIQNIKQLEDVYGETKGQVIAAGFSNVFAFRMTDEASRKYVSDLFGKNYYSVRYRNRDGENIDTEREGYTVEDWQLMSLDVGQAVVGITGYTPFTFRFTEYQK